MTDKLTLAKIESYLAIAEKRALMGIHECGMNTREVIALCKAAQREDGLRRALKNLLADTQHADHNCGEDGCPVDEARDALHFAELAAITGAAKDPEYLDIPKFLRRGDD